MTFFDLFSLFYALLGVRALWTLKQNWRAFTDADLTSFDQRMASEIAFFVFVPIGVLFHELGHAIATYQVGGTIDWLNGGFHYALFYGYVIPEGRFTPLQDWWIALSGNLISIVFGFLPLILLRFTDKPWIKYTILAFARIQLGWALVGYPLLTFAGFQGDWWTIYFAIPVIDGIAFVWQTAYFEIPLFGGITFVFQAALVIALWRFDRSVIVKRWEVGLYAGAQDQLRNLDNAIAARPGSPDPLIARGNFFAAQNQIGLALADYRAALKLDPQNPRALTNIGQIRLMQKRYTDAEKSFRGALTRADSGPQVGARVHYGLATCLYNRGKATEAISEFSAAIARAPEIADFYFWRGIARRQIGDDANARNDFARAAELAATSDPALAARAREMLVNSEQ